jgi:hypothetical protein
MKIGQLTVKVDPLAGAIYVYLVPMAEFHAARQERPAKGVVVDLDSEGHLIGAEFIGPGKLEINVKQVANKYHAPKLNDMLKRREYLEEQLAGARN